MTKTNTIRRHPVSRKLSATWWAACLTFGLMSVGMIGVCRSASPNNATRQELPKVLTRDQAVRWALENNPDLASLRQQHGIAAAGIVIAQTYPFNPVLESKVRAANGPISAGITNRVSNEHKVFIDVELRGQWGHRRETARAALSRTDWEIAFQELTLATRVSKAYDTVLYRQAKLRLLQQTVDLNQKAADQIRKSFDDAGKGTKTDPLISLTEVDDARAQYGAGRIALAAAMQDLRRTLGIVGGDFQIKDESPAAPPEADTEKLVKAALERRPDLHARQEALLEAEAKVRLEISNRYGNPNLGPAYEYDPTRINLIGVQLTMPLPCFNTKQGEIQQRRAERDKAAMDLRGVETLIRQDVHAALIRVKEARAWTDTYRTKVLPNLENTMKTLENLYGEADPAVDLLKLLDVRRKLLKARDGSLDAQWELNQAKVDLAASLGEPVVDVTTPPAP